MNLRDRLLVTADADSVAERAAQSIAASARASIAAHGRFDLALTGATSPLDTYARLAAAPYHDGIDWALVHLFWGDERAVTIDRTESNYGAAHARLVRHVPIPVANVHRMEAEREDLERAASEYAALLHAHCAATDDGVPVLDVLLLGLGGDGHILSLYPGCAEISATTSDVVALRDPPMNPPIARITLTPRPLLAAREIVLFAHGASKATALAALLDGPEDPARVPAQLLRRVASRVTVLADRAATSQLSA